MLKRLIFFTIIFASVSGCATVQQQNASPPYLGPVIDVHLHSFTLMSYTRGDPPRGVCIGASENTVVDPVEGWTAELRRRLKQPPCDNPIWSPTTAEAMTDELLAELDRLNVTAVVSGDRDLLAEWMEKRPARIIPGFSFSVGLSSESPEEIAAMFENGEFAVFGEIANQYYGVTLDDPRFEDYWRVAAENDMPVGIHVGMGGPGAPYSSRGFRARNHSPLALEEVLIRHPTLRVYLMHAAWPMVEDMKAMLYNYPQLHVDIAALQFVIPRGEYYALLEALVQAGFGDRILFGSDQVIWPELIEEGINAINDAPFLSYAQKKAILHDNAVRFLRLHED